MLLNLLYALFNIIHESIINSSLLHKHYVIVRQQFCIKEVPLAMLLERSSVSTVLAKKYKIFLFSNIDLI